MNREASRSERGFTLVELMLAMAFISILLIVIALTVIQVSNIYNKGLTMKAVNQAGRELSTDMRQVLGQSQPFNLDTSFRLQRNAGTSETDPPEAGRLCTGVYSYIWNFGATLDDPINKYADSDEEIRFVRARDTDRQYCANTELPIQKEGAVELLAGGDRDLALQNFLISKVADDVSTGQALYKIVMVIGTNNQDAIEPLDTIDTTCKPPSDTLSLEEFCAVNRFDFTAQAGNQGEQ